MRRLGVLLLAALLAGCGSGPPELGENTLAAKPPRLRAEQVVRVPMTDELGAILLLPTRVCRPRGSGPFPLAILAMPGAQPRQERRDLDMPGCDSAPARWFLARHYIVALPERRGYGNTLAGYAADPGSCAAPDYVHAGIEAARDIAAAGVFLEQSPDVRRRGLVVAGEDEGGWAALAYGSVPNPDLVAVIAVDAGMGGRAASELGHVCRPDLLIEAARTFGATSRAPELWIDARDDPVFPSDLTGPMVSAFRTAGGVAVLDAPDVPVRFGHLWFFTDRGAAIWAPLLARFLGG